VDFARDLTARSPGLNTRLQGPGKVQPYPAYLLNDDAAAEKAAKAVALTSPRTRTTTVSARQQERAQKNRRKITKAARRENP
jgi:hypothetical protein